MSTSVGSTRDTEIVERKVKKRTFFANLFRKKIEIDSDKLKERIGTSVGKESTAPGVYRWEVTKTGLVELIKAKCKVPPDHMPLSNLKLSIWCDLPASLWDEFSRDGQFLADVGNQVNSHMERMIETWAQISDSAEREIPELGIDVAQENFKKNSDHMVKQWEDGCAILVENLFSEKVKTFGDYTRYKVKAGAKLASTFAGIAISIAALSTAATPAAPATLIPAIIGLVASCGSAINQIKSLFESAGTVRLDIQGKLATLSVQWKDGKGKWNKKTFQAVEATTALASAATGGLSEIAFPSIDGLLSRNGLLRSKTDGMEVDLHDLGVGINALVDALEAAEKVLADNRDNVREKFTSGDLKKATEAIKKLEKSIEAFNEVRHEFETNFDEISAVAKEIKELREDYEKFQSTLEEAEKHLKTKNIALFINIVYSLGTIGANFASPPTHVAEKITASLGTIQAGLDGIREYTKPVAQMIT
jgi:hypothetical protein